MRERTITYLSRVSRRDGETISAQFCSRRLNNDAYVLWANGDVDLNFEDEGYECFSSDEFDDLIKARFMVRSGKKPHDFFKEGF